METGGRLYTVDQVAGMLGLHAKTVRGYVRDGRLKAARLGKRYRITAEDLEEFAGQPVAPGADAAAPAAAPAGPGAAGGAGGRPPHAEATTIVQVDAADRDAAHRITTVLGAAMTAPERGRRESPLRVETVYDEERAVLKVILLGGLERVAGVLRILGAVVEDTQHG
ncbi:helix-turn-helix domain-containing protein [Streptomyces aidingensis]|uniref:DNA binding domain-containing protein, excisionase family n=1 Tax=Streptomyces aidingensis TaxID=910347 RepID=A0A1I1F6G8_9ACTN|nr:helix-turn-helix domain-containing protein [Streptomyces aidingensis]SFB94891.1 DNA binding domain-containing protein, excisionase family [Streptomyces aidingensis]